MSAGKQHKSYTAADIAAYLNGSLSDAEMHAMERAALDDPFLADALDGFSKSTVPAPELSKQLNEALGSRIRRSKPKGITFPNWFRYAAVAAAVVGTWLVFRPNHSTTQEPEFVQQQVQKPVITDSQTAVTPADSQSIALSPVRPPELVPASPVLTPSSPGTVETTTIESKDLSSGNIARSEEEAPKAIAMSRQAAPAAGVLSSTGNVVIGVVVDQNNQPVPGATVKASNGSVTTDHFGRFEVKTEDSAVSVEVQSVGFAAARSTVSTSQPTDTIFLTPSDMALNEVVVVGYGAKKKGKSVSRNRTAMRPIAEPEVPLDEYNDYITENLDDLDLAGDPDAEMVVSFMVSKNGSLSEFKVERPAPTEALTAKAMRLIQQGPKWKVRGGDSAKATVIVVLGRKK